MRHTERPFVLITVPAPQRLIPRPRKKLRPSATDECIRQIIGVALSEHKELKKVIRAHGRKLLDPKQPISNQDKWDEFVSAVCEEKKWFRKFEGQWPLEILVGKYLRGVETYNLKKLSLRQHGAVATTSEGQCENRRPTKNTRQRAVARTSIPLANTTQLNIRPAGFTISEQATNRYLELDWTPEITTSISNISQCSPTVAQFLQRIKLPYLSTTFQRLGIITAAHLNILYEMNVGTRNRFLQKLVQSNHLTPLENVVLESAFMDA